MSTKKKSVKQSAKTPAPSKVKPVAPPIRFPEEKGTPLRPEQFPTVDELSRLAASLAGTLPDTHIKAEKLIESALSLWLAARDGINAQKLQADKYWEKMDRSQQGIESGYDQVKQRLEKLGAFELADQLLSKKKKNEACTLSWAEAEALLFPDSTPGDRSLQLTHMVSSCLLGTEGCWRLWTLDKFKELGFDHFAVVTLIQFYDYQEIDREKIELSERMKSVRGMRPKKTKWGKLAKQPTSRKKDS